MLTSDTTGAIAPALAKAQAELEHADKTKNNPHFRSKYADLAGVVDTIKPVFAKHDLFYTQGFEPAEQGVVIHTRIYHKSGEFIGDTGLHLPLDKNNAQGVGSAITYGRRYALLALAGVAPHEDDDGNAASAKPAPKAAAKPKPKPEPDAPAYVTPEQAAELAAAAVAAGKDPKLAKRWAETVLASEFVARLAKAKEKANA